MSRLLHFAIALLTTALPVRGAERAPIDLRSLDQDDRAAEAALARGDVDGALQYFDYFGHEQEDFARATLEYRLARQKLGQEVRAAFGRRAWGRAAAALGVPRHRRGRNDAERSVRREGDVLYVKNSGAGNEVPYVNVKGVWKVSVRGVLAAAVQARFGKSVEFEEADLYVLAGKMGRVLRARAAHLTELAANVRAKRVTSADHLNAAIERIRKTSE